jgi:hypothetical protein
MLTVGGRLFRLSLTYLGQNEQIMLTLAPRTVIFADVMIDQQGRIDGEPSLGGGMSPRCRLAVGVLVAANPIRRHEEV